MPIIIKPKNIYEINNNKVVDNIVDNVQLNENQISLGSSNQTIIFQLFKDDSKDLASDLTIEKIKDRNPNCDVYNVFDRMIINETYRKDKRTYVKIGVAINIPNYDNKGILFNSNGSRRKDGQQGTEEVFQKFEYWQNNSKIDIKAKSFQSFINENNDLPFCSIISDKSTINNIYLGFNIIAYRSYWSQYAGGDTSPTEYFVHYELTTNVNLFYNCFIKTLNKNIFGNGKKSFKLQDSSLITNHTTLNGNKISNVLANNILREYRNGKELAEIDIDIGEYYDNSGNLAISSKESNLPMLFKNGDVVIPYVRTSKVVDNQIIYGEEPLGGTINNPKEFIVIATQTFNKGYCGQKLTIREK